VPGNPAQRREQGEAVPGGPEQGVGGKERETWISALANTIIRSLKFNITNVHVWYEDQQLLGRAAAAPCSAGVMLSKLAAVTVGDGDSPASGKSPSLSKVSKVSVSSPLMTLPPFCGPPCLGLLVAFLPPWTALCFVWLADLHGPAADGVPSCPWCAQLVEMQQLALYFIPQSSLQMVEEGDVDRNPGTQHTLVALLRIQLAGSMGIPEEPLPWALCSLPPPFELWSY